MTAKDNRLFVEAVLYRYRAGIPWRDLPERFGDFRVVHTRFSRWATAGVWARVFEHLAQDADNEYAMIDATIVRAHQLSAGAQKKARMNQDLRMGDKLKATGAGNLFVVFGEPDIVIHKCDGDMIRVEIRGMDIFDPTTGQVRSSRPASEIKAALARDPELTAEQFSDSRNDVAAGFIDDDYDEDNFFVRQAYFVGDSPYEGLKRALKAEIDDAAWEEMNATISRSFPKPENGRICVKVINHFGDEVQKVFVV